MRNMRFIVARFFKFQTFQVRNQQIDLGLTLKFRSKVKYEQIIDFLGYDCLYPVNTIFCSKTYSKQVIEH
jgi:hypothetical protein